MITIFTIKTTNPNYNGVTEGVTFVNGVAEVSDEFLRNVLVNNYGYIDATEVKPTTAAESKPEGPATKRKADGK